MLLTINIGNTHTGLALWDGPTIIQRWQLPTDRERPVAEWATLLAELWAGDGIVPEEIGGAICASVVPPATPTLAAALAQLGAPRPLLLGEPGADPGLPLDVDTPETVGQDRIANCVAARALVGPPALVVDLGTATTFSLLDPHGAFAGGAIAPGLGLAADTLAARTAQLPRVPLTPPPNVIGRQTILAIQSGLVWGWVGLVEGLVGRIRAECAARGWPPVPTLATGGLAPTLAPLTPALERLEPDLLMIGLRLIYERNIQQELAV